MATVAYFANPLTPGRQYFDCERLRARLCTGTCAAMWREANGRGEGRETCRRCPLGANHAGEADASTSEFAGALICSRCHRPASRLIGGMHCVSCKNREYEFLKGRNAKGTTPVKLACLTRRRIRFLAGAQPCMLALPLTLDPDELIVAALRDHRERVRFGLGVAIPPTVRQLRLF